MEATQKQKEYLNALARKAAEADFSGCHNPMPHIDWRNRNITAEEASEKILTYKQYIIARNVQRRMIGMKEVRFI